MKNRSSVLFIYLLFIVAASLACQTLSGTTTQAPPEESQPQSQIAKPTANQNSETTSDLVVFVDKNNLAQFEVPGDWEYSQSDVEGGYVDSFASPDGNALMENFVYDDGTSFTGGQNGKAALYLLHRYYSATGKEGDIKVISDAVQADGSERLVWTSRSGGFSGVSFFEVRNRTTFLMLTGKWVNETEETYLPIVNHTIETYRIP